MLPDGICFIIDMTNYVNNDNISFLTYITIVNKRNEANLTQIDIRIEDPNQLFYWKRMFDLQGDKIFHKENINLFKYYTLKTTVTRNLEDEPYANCIVYEKTFTYENCRRKEALSFLLPLLGCVPPMLQDHETTYVNETCTGNRSDDANDYLGKMWNDFGKTSCRVSCTTIQYAAASMRHLQHNSSATVIRFEKDVTYWKKTPSMTSYTVWSELGSALGLYLGFGILQLAEKIEEIIIKIWRKLASFKASRDEVMERESIDHSNVNDSTESQPYALKSDIAPIELVFL